MFSVRIYPTEKQHKISVSGVLPCTRAQKFMQEREWMNGVLGHFYALSRLNWAGDNLG